MDTADTPVRYAKTARPLPINALARQRLFERLDSAISHPVVWVSGPPGAGKTTLVTDYLAHRSVDTIWYQVDESDADPASFFYFISQALQQRTAEGRSLPLLSPEYLPDLEKFARRYFRELFSRLHAPFALVLDNFQDNTEASGLVRLLLGGLSEIPPGGNVFVIGRGDPPAQLARFRANAQLVVIGWEDLKLTRREQDDIVTLHNLQFEDEALTSLYRRTQGWVVALVMLISDKRALTDSGVLQPSPALAFEYFGEVIFRQLEAPSRDLLLRISMLPQFSPVLAQRLCPEVDAKAVLAGLNPYAHLLITTPYGDGMLHQLHPLAREFLQRKAREIFSAEELLVARRRAASLLSEQGQNDAAAQLLIDIEDWPALQVLIVQQAENLLAQGRAETLLRWIQSMPAAAGKSEPWLMYWSASARFASAPNDASVLFEAAYLGFCAQADDDGITGRFLSLSGLLDTLVHDPDDLHPLDRWIPETEKLIASRGWPSEAIQARVTQSLFMAMVLRQPQHPQLYEWGERTLALMQGSGPPRLRMTAGLYVATVLIWTGRFGRASALLDTLRGISDDRDVPAVALVTLRQLESMFHMLQGHQDSCLEAVYDGLDLAGNSGVTLWQSTLLLYGAGASLAAGDHDTSAELLQRVEAGRFRTRRFGACMQHYFLGWDALLRGDSWRAHEHARESCAIAERLGAPFFQALAGLALVQSLVAIGEVAAARSQIDKVMQVASPIRSHLFDFLSLLAVAQLARTQGENDVAEARLRVALAMGRERGFTCALYWLPEQLAQLCVFALERRIEPAYIASLIRARNLLPAVAPYRLESWPWSWRVRVLGPFDLELSARDASGNSTRSQSRALELLKALVAMGGRKIPLERVADALWPRIDSDYAQRSLSTTLHRLRKLLGDDSAIVLQAGMLSLHSHRFWIDTWALEQALGECQDLLKIETASPLETPDTTAALQAVVERVMSLYRGQLLQQDHDYAWAAAPRQQLHARMLRFIFDAARHLERRGKPAAAVQLLHRGIDLDPLSESLYRQLMDLHLRQGQRTEAIDAYERCRDTLRHSLQGEPSAQMQKLFMTIGV